MESDKFDKQLVILELDNCENIIKRIARDYNKYYDVKAKAFHEGCSFDYHDWVSIAKGTMDKWLSRELEFIKNARNNLKEEIKE